MAFEKSISTTYAELDEQTRYRFAEIELGKALQPLTTLHLFATTPRQAAHNLLLTALMPSNASNTKVQAFSDLLNAHSTLHPAKPEIIQYLLVQGHSYGKVREITSSSFNTIAKYKFGVPQYYPTYPYWDQELLQKWNHIKRTLNLFHEELAHCKQS